MDILQVASEMTPIAKVGGLGDVLMGLTRELIQKGHTVLPVLPAYGAIDLRLLTPDGRVDRFSTMQADSSVEAAVTYYRFDKNLPVALLDTEGGFFRSRRTIYGDASPEASFLFFCRCVVDWLLASNRPPDIVHVHDWPTALVPELYRARTGQHPPFGSLFTVHNFEYQGRCSQEDLAAAGLALPDPSILNDPQYPCLNLVKAGLLTADIVTTVSPTYASEVRTPGESLYEVLSGLNERFIGVLNGLDSSFWNPREDPYISVPYGPSDAQSAKKQNREKLLSFVGIPSIEGVPLIASVTRLVDQKGIWMIKDLFCKAEELQFQGLIIGSVPDPEAKKAFSELDLFLRSCGRGAVFQVSDEEMAHKIYAVSDLFVVPSIVEPCGLTQLIALAYGSVPVVRKTGGLSDTIIDVDTASPEANGFVFNEPLSEDFISTVKRALQLFADKPRWAALLRNGMQQDHSWARPCDTYLALYKKAMQRKFA